MILPLEIVNIFEHLLIDRSATDIDSKIFIAVLFLQ